MCKKYFKEKAFLFVFMLLYFQSCTNNDIDITPINPTKFPESFETFRIEEGCYSNLFVIDSFLIMTANCNLEDNDKETRIHVYNKENLKLITKFSTVGLASYEFSSTAFPLSTIQKSDQIRFYDSNIWHFKTINLDKFLFGETINECFISTPMEKNLIGNYNIKILDEYRFMGRNQSPFQKGMFFIYDTQKKEMNWIEPIPKVRGVKVQHKVDLHYGNFIANNPKNIILYSSKFFDQVLFYDYNRKLLKHYAFSPLKTPILYENERLPATGSLMYFFNVFATSEYFFVNRRGGKLLAVGSEPLAPDDPSYIKQLLVFSWDGSLIKTFNEYIGDRFCYDNEFDVFYTIESSDSENDPHTIVRKFYLGDYLKEK